jgi:hypothetical protein
MALPDYLQQYAKSDDEILQGRVLPKLTHHGKADGRGGVVGSGKTGRKPMYITGDQMQYAVDLYFDKCEINEEEPTVPGLALALGFSGKAQMKAYEGKNEDFEHVLQTAKTRIEHRANVALTVGGPATQGNMFLLKNHHGYSDKVESTVTHGMDDALTRLVDSLQGKVHRPTLPINDYETITEAEYEEENAFEEVTSASASQHKGFPSANEYAEPIEDDASDLC